ncbi:MAG: HAD family hydrolase [Bacteroidetes bacterium]|nr:MAG: HAD family hydrolase [Bacteroidota bacterium]
MEKKPSLFLDRDGVINRRIPGSYIADPADFVPEPGALEALKHLNNHFGHIVVVTNQAGIGKGLMTEVDLGAVHQKMRALVAAAGGRIDKIYFCPHRPEAGCACRKPGTGMAEQAKADFPDIDFARSWIVGDSASDMRLGQALGMKTVLIAGKFEEAEKLAALEVDHRFDSLLDFAIHLER